MEKRRADVTPLKKIIYHESAKEESNWWSEAEASEISQKKIAAIFGQMKEYKKLAEEAESEKMRIARIKIEELMLEKGEAVEVVNTHILKCQAHMHTISQLRKQISQKKEEPAAESGKPVLVEEDISEYVERMERLEGKVQTLLSRHAPNLTKVVKALEQENKDLSQTIKTLGEKIEAFLAAESALHAEKRELSKQIAGLQSENAARQEALLQENERIKGEKTILQRRVDEVHLAIETLNSAVVERARELENIPANKNECEKGCHERIQELENKEIARLEEVTFLVRKYIDTGKQNDLLLLEIEELKSQIKASAPPASPPPCTDWPEEKEKEIEKLKTELERSSLGYIERKTSAQYHKRKSLQYEAELSAARKTAADMDIVNKALQEKLEESIKNKSANKSQSDLDLYKGMVRCGVCCSNIKNVALKRCMHLMCRACIDDRMATRQKTCPLCGTVFSPNDIANVYL
ncbi:uncharacterized protein NEMAJ01_0146 [Nematocida major]|uniref:uncharacterized protein n=1 Tax=Nematocida major TaxID=1912982 RepID=UPI002007C888|nr:uncharacterized protein NEMAJ01_0146 [Nematocida major]KAH9385250.1 hypothetical protein NEMAJ01_0146 [Nematocida major]